ncbi:MAG TPA: TerC/Alx family metal homeostasis membrane protein [Pseudomonadales bacterium]
MTTALFIWCSFIAVIMGLIVLDLLVLHRQPGVIGTRTALKYWAGWMALAVLFNVYIYFLYETNWLGWGLSQIRDLDGAEASLQFLTGYLIELSLSIDNVFVIMMIFEFMRVPPALQHRVLFWGILGAILLRALMILLGAALIAKFDWVTYVLGAILIVSAGRMLAISSETDPSDILAVRLAQRLIPVSPQFDGAHFLTRVDGKLLATPMFLTLVMVEWADVVFAVDSVPAIFAVTRDPFLVFTSNVFAILGLRTLFFVISGMVREMAYLKFSLVFILTFVGIKMILGHHLDIPSWVSLVVVTVSIAVGVMASLWSARFRAND